MKLLSWMLTTKQNGFIPSKEFNGGFGCLRAQVFSDVQDIRTNSFSFSESSHEPNPPKVREEHLFDEDGFCGFLAIGTLGTDPETPKFSDLVGQVTTEKNEMAKLITEKLDKFLEEQSEAISSTRVERLNANGEGESNVCPRQDHEIDLTKRSNVVKKKKDLLTRLFKRRHTVRGETSTEKHGPRDVLKNVFKFLHEASSKTRNGDDDSMPKKKDLRKSAQICRGKVHPLLCTPARDDNEIENKGKLDLNVPCLTGGFLGSNSIAEANMKKRENWITTDTEYLVLEL